MKEIKFRAWDKLDKRMIQVNTFQQIPSNWKSTWDLMQYTGLKDKNGKEIYEGDVMYSKNGILIVVYQAPSFVMKQSKEAKTWHEFILHHEENQFQEVIGNIHENPELLKSSEGTNAPK